MATLVSRINDLAAAIRDKFNAVATPAIVNKGTVTSGTVTFDRAASPYQVLTVGGPLALAVSNWSGGGTYSEISLELIAGGSAALTYLRRGGGARRTEPGEPVLLTPYRRLALTFWSPSLATAARPCGWCCEGAHTRSAGFWGCCQPHTLDASGDHGRGGHVAQHENRRRHYFRRRGAH